MRGNKSKQILLIKYSSVFLLLLLLAGGAMLFTPPGIAEGKEAVTSGDPDVFHIVDPYKTPGQWYKVQLHVHTEHSIDSRWPVADALQAYADADFDFVAITDHNKLTEPVPDDVPPNLIVIPGEEITVYYPLWPYGKHAVHLFAEGHISQGRAVKRFNQIAEAGGLVSIAHPHWSGNIGSGRWGKEALGAAPQFTLFEIFNRFSNFNLDLRLWHEVTVERGPEQPVWAIAVDDAHEPGDVNRAWTMVKAEERSLAGVRRGLERGSLYPTTGPLLSFRVQNGAITVTEGNPAAEAAPGQPAVEEEQKRYDVSFVDATRQRVKRHNGPLPATYEPTGGEGFIRVEVIDPSTRGRAWSQPFWILPVPRDE